VYAVASDSAGRRSNPSWYLLDARSGRMEPLDQVTGPVDELPEAAGGWSGADHFVYAKGVALWDARVSRTGGR
jgi:hypothetical protein